MSQYLTLILFLYYIYIIFHPSFVHSDLCNLFVILNNQAYAHHVVFSPLYVYVTEYVFLHQFTSLCLSLNDVCYKNTLILKCNAPVIVILYKCQRCGMFFC